MLGASQALAATQIASGYQIEMAASAMPYSRTTVRVKEFEAVQSTFWLEEAHEMR